MSVRSKVTRKQVEDIEPVYRRMLTGEVVAVPFTTKLARTMSNTPMFLKVFTSIELPVVAITGFTMLNDPSIAHALSITGIGFITALIMSYCCLVATL